MALAISVAALAIYWLYYSFFTPYTAQTTFFPESDFARSTHSVYTFVNILMLIIFVVIEGVLVWVLFRFRKEDAKRGDPLPDQVHGNTKIEVGLTVATTLLVIVLFVPSCQQIQYAQSEGPEDALVVEVNGRQWWWEFYYPEYDLVTANEIHLPVGRTVRFNMTSSDVIHAFWIPRLGGKRDTVPGRTQHIWLTPEKVGVYDGQCAEFCGTAHALMSMQVIVDTPEDFEAWVANQKAPPDPTLIGQYFPTFAQAGCIACHTTVANDSTTRGPVHHSQDWGPNLKKVGSRLQIASGIMDNNLENLTDWIGNPQHLKPGALMKVPAPQCLAAGDPDPCCTEEGRGNCLDDATVRTLASYMQELN